MSYDVASFALIYNHDVARSQWPREVPFAIQSERYAVVKLTTGETVPSRVHSQTIDHDWKLVKEQLPDNTSARTEEERTVLDEYIRAAQWRMQHSTRDFWKPRVHHD